MSFRQINDDDDCSTGRSYIDAKLRKCWSIPPSDLSSSMISDQYYVINWDQPTTDITEHFRSCSLRLWICSSVTFGFVWTQHVDLCLKTFIFPVDLTFHIFAVPRCQFHRCWMASYFPVKLPGKENHFWHSLHLKLKRGMFKGTPIRFSR